jgi:hypothetical protein
MKPSQYQDSQSGITLSNSVYLADALIQNVGPTDHFSDHGHRRLSTTRNARIPWRANLRIQRIQGIHAPSCRGFDHSRPDRRSDTAPT